MVKITHTTISAALLSSSSEDIRADSEDSDDRVMTSGSDADDDDTLNTSSLSSSLASYENSASDEICSTKITLSSDDSIAQIVREKTVQNLQQCRPNTTRQSMMGTILFNPNLHQCRLESVLNYEID